MWWWCGGVDGGVGGGDGLVVGLVMLGFFF